MCNLAGYIGDRPAADVLLPMMEAQEGFGGGYYTGIATIADGRLYHAKVVGDVAALRRETDAERLPGTVGIAHSRSKSGGDREWGHPFIDCSGRLAYVANGHDGFFEAVRDKDAVATQLARNGHTFLSRTQGGIATYPTLPDGTCVHTSDVMCHLIESLVEPCGDPAAAMKAAFMQFPAEIVGLMLHTDAPDSVIASRINQPLMVGRDSSAVYAATTAMAFRGVEPDWLTPMPMNTTAVIRRDGVGLLPFDPPRGPAAGPTPWGRAYEAVLNALSDGQGHSLGALTKVTAALWPDGVVSPNGMMVYEILRELLGAGRIRIESVRVPGVIEGTTAPHMRAELVDV